jgi:hypothetical protein
MLRFRLTDAFCRGLSSTRRNSTHSILDAPWQSFLIFILLSQEGTPSAWLPIFLTLQYFRIRLVSRQERDNDKYRRRFRIEHNNAGVEFIEAVGNFKQAVINQPILRQQKILTFQDRLPPYFEGINWMQMLKGKEPLMKVKLTHTTDGASILAVSFAHVIVG